MSVALDPAVEAQLDSGQIARVDLIRFDLPNNPVGYHRGGRPYTYNGLKYLPNRWLSLGSMSPAVGVAVTTRTIRFSDVPVSSIDDAIARLEEFEYVNAPVVIAHLAGIPNSNTVLGVLASSLYEIDHVRYLKSAINENGERELTIEIDLQPPGRSARGQTLVKRSPKEQQFDNDPNDTSLEYVAVNGTQTMEWGQRSG